ncbi:MAG: hypothetical protein Q4P06_05670 [Actinomycetaceae bacterium]|nr:hypothetical protein [Actinomycetaceae bacterium]
MKIAYPPAQSGGSTWQQILRPSADLTGALEELGELTAKTRFAEALRRGWETCRAEAAITSAAAGANIDGIRVDTGYLRQLVTANDPDSASLRGMGALGVTGTAGVTGAAGANPDGGSPEPSPAQSADAADQAGWAYWRAHVWVTQLWEPLNVRGPRLRQARPARPPLPQRAAKIHALLTPSDVTRSLGASEVRGRVGRNQASAGPVEGTRVADIAADPAAADTAAGTHPAGIAAGTNPADTAAGTNPAPDLVSRWQVGIPSDPQAWQVFSQLLQLKAPAPVRTGLALAHASQNPFFTHQTMEVTRVLVRDELTSCGFDPTGTWQWEPVWADNQMPVTAALANVNLRQGSGIENWLQTWVQLLIDAHAPTRELLRRVQAGVL